ncbi:NAD(P)/FAD-dependent oxidoreductase [Saccharopolyspora rhizosphaerae]|uniref:NAD(P)/FAD-dependent oxidoreductase n=1 Tax=Saccharopolyspora rhizosphaerae TaxID=2492662 RepID=A0A426K3B2_9PSEU|nr:NAD(P)/FAD-dependent oxidoreductase [Saccharopolyspora rhizosphaerae]RRO19869.1 NAD(P)/FAD-dependent oxidoreductase [Saccharopolyspora rhizosphaerae]
MTDEVDVVVVGMGPGGEDVAARLARAGLSVVGVESRLVGGECPYYACVPTKIMVRATDALAEARRVPELAGSNTVTPDWSPVAARIRDEATTGWNDEAAVRRFEDAGGRLVRGVGSITAPGEVTVGEQVLRARRAIVLNPGTEPAVPPIEGLAGTPYWTNREAVAAERVPQSLIVLGGGPVGMEFSQVFARFGAEVTLVEAKPQLLPLAEPEAAEVITDCLLEEGLRVRVGSTVQGVRHDGTFHVTTEGEEFEAEALLVATGRRTDLRALGVAAVGLDDSAGTIDVDERMRAADGVWAVGDVTGRGAYTHTSVYQSRIAAADILGEPSPPADYRAMPSVTFTDPEVALVGLTETQAVAEHDRVRTALSRLPESPRGFIHKVGNEGLVKLVADTGRGVLVGATVVGPAGGEIVGALAVAVHAEVPVASLNEMIFAYPTFHRAIQPALEELAAS